MADYLRHVVDRPEVTRAELRPPAPSEIPPGLIPPVTGACITKREMISFFFFSDFHQNLCPKKNENSSKSVLDDYFFCYKPLDISCFFPPSCVSLKKIERREVASAPFFSLLIIP